MTDDRILLKALKKTKRYEFNIDKYDGISCDGHILFLNQYGVVEVHEHYFYYIFDSEFAEILGYKLKDLGNWCDEGKEPLKFIWETLMGR